MSGDLDNRLMNREMAIIAFLYFSKYSAYKRHVGKFYGYIYLYLNQIQVFSIIR